MDPPNCTARRLVRSSIAGSAFSPIGKLMFEYVSARGCAFAGAFALWSAMCPLAAQSATSVRAAHPHGISAGAPRLRAVRAAIVPSNITPADPPVARPDTTPCVVPLFKNLAFEDFTPKPFQFMPPAACAAPWSKVVLSVHFSVTPGVQFDRTAEIGLGGSTIFFGTTAEPFANEGPAWTVGRDETDLSALFRRPQSGQISLGNVVNQQYTGIIYGSATLAFYPPDAKYPAPRVADVVVPLADPLGDAVPLSSSSSVLATVFTPPKNVERAYLDVIAQSQSADEFWYTCVPNNLTGPLNDCGNTAFRETDAAVDGKPAGVSPVYPWIFTGGIDPFLWAPIPGVQTLNFVPYRIDLTPFAGQLDTGGSHTVALTEFNANNFFAVTGNLLLFLDAGASALTGGLDTDTLAATPPEVVSEHGTFNPDGTVNTRSARSFALSGHLQTSHGFVRTQVNESIQFVQHEAIVNSPTQFEQAISQDETVSASTFIGGASPSSVQTWFNYPLQLFYDYSVNADGTAQQQTSVHQGYVISTSGSVAHGPPSWSFVSDTVSPQDTLHFDASGNFTGFSNNASSQIYQAGDSTGGCYGRKVAARNLVVFVNVDIGCK